MGTIKKRPRPRDLTHVYIKFLTLVTYYTLWKYIVYYLGDTLYLTLCIHYNLLLNRQPNIAVAKQPTTITRTVNAMPSMIDMLPPSRILINN